MNIKTENKKNTSVRALPQGQRNTIFLHMGDTLNLKGKIVLHNGCHKGESWLTEAQINKLSIGHSIVSKASLIEHNNQICLDEKKFLNYLKLHTGSPQLTTAVCTTHYKIQH